jgi:hypothetical protein
MRAAAVPQRDSVNASTDRSLLAAPSDKDADNDAEDAEEKEPGADKTEAKDGKGETKDAKAEGAASADAWDFSEKPHTTYHWLGARGRIAVIPQFMLGIFADGGRTVISPQVGPELAVRRNGFEYDLWLTYARYYMDDAPFKASSDPDTSYEIVRSRLHTISIGSDFLWSKPLHTRLDFVYGVGFGIGIVFGDLYRTQAYPPNGPGDPKTYLPCTAPQNPNAAYCQNDNGHYGGYKENSWINGGQKPVLFPWVSPFQLGLRWKPHPKVVMRLDLGVSFPGPVFFGIAGQYGL